MLVHREGLSLVSCDKELLPKLVRRVSDEPFEILQYMRAMLNCQSLSPLTLVSMSFHCKILVDFLFICLFDPEHSTDSR